MSPFLHHSPSGTRIRSWHPGLGVLLVACGQSHDTIGHRDDPPPVVEDTGWRTDFDACATEHEEAVAVPTSLFIAVDRSSSMSNPADGRTTGTTTGTVTKWDEASSAFTTFFTDPGSATLDVALRLWPTPDPTDGCDDVNCDPVACSVPTVPLGSVGDPAQQTALVDALTTGDPDPNSHTPMHAALDGAVRWATARALEAPDEEVAIVLVTDGAPNGCDEDIDHIADLATTAAAAGVPVYAVGIEGSNVAQMDQIATAGGTTASYFVGSASAEADLLAALDDIQAKSLSCRFTFPSPSTGDPLSPDLVRVEYTVAGDLVSVGRVGDASQCADGGWYLDDPQDPSTITLCPSTCDELQGIGTVSIDIDVGCECTSDADCTGADVCTSQGCVPPCEGPGCVDVAESVPALSGRVAVQGGALSCETGPGRAGALLVVAALVAARSRRREAP